MSQDPDAALMLAFQGGDRAAFRTLYQRYARAMVGYCHRFVKDAARAEELAQDVFLKVHATAARWTPSARFKTWLYRVATNHCLNELRRAEHQARQEAPRDEEGTPDLDALASPAASPHQALEGRRLEAALRRCLAKLPESQRAAFVLCRLEGLSYEEIAETLETSVSAVKSLIHRASLAVAAALDPDAAPQEGRT
jgi:RNA polymerase sigma-70 factor (ECF subfamily)